MSDNEWTPITPENSDRDKYQPWAIKCPECGKEAITAYGSSDDLKCPVCRASVELGIRKKDN